MLSAAAAAAPELEARQLTLPKSIHAPSPYVSALLFDPHSNSLAVRNSDSSFSIYPSVSPFSTPSFPSPQTLISSQNSSATFLRIQTDPNAITTLFLTCSPVLSPSSSTLFRFYVLRDNRYSKLEVVSNHRDLEFDRGKGGVVFKVNHGVSMKLSGGSNVFSLYSVSNSRVWVFAVRLTDGDGGGEAVKLMKCAVIDCCFPIFEIKVLFGFLILGEENGVRVFALRTVVKGKHKKEKKNGGKRLNLSNGLINGVSNGGKTVVTNGDSGKGEKTEKNSDSVKSKFVRLRQDSRDMGALFVAFKDKDFESSMPRRSVKALSIQALSANKFLILDSVGDIHILCLSYSQNGLDSPCMMKLTQTMKVRKLAVFYDVSTATGTVWICDGCYTVHMMMISVMDTTSLDESEGKNNKEKLVKTSVQQAFFTGEKIQNAVPLSANAILILGQGNIFAYGFS